MGTEGFKYWLGIKRGVIVFLVLQKGSCLPPSTRRDARHTGLTFYLSTFHSFWEALLPQHFMCNTSVAREENCLAFVLTSPSKSSRGSKFNRASLTLAFDPLPTHSFSFHALILSEAHSFWEAAFQRLEQMGQWGDTTVWHHCICPFRRCLVAAARSWNWDGNRTTGMEMSGSCPWEHNAFNMGVVNALD